MMLDKIHKIRGMCQVVDLWPLPGPRGYKLFFMLNSTEHEISTVYKA